MLQEDCPTEEEIFNSNNFYFQENGKIFERKKS